jgi:hypothetical protein
MHRMFSPEGKFGGVRRMFSDLFFSCIVIPSLEFIESITSRAVPETSIRFNARARGGYGIIW